MGALRQPQASKEIDTMKKTQLLSLVFIIYLFITAPVHAAETYTVGDACANFGSTLVDKNGENIIACLRNTDHTGYIWKSMTGSNGGGVPVGSIIAWLSSSLPPQEDGTQKWAECNGQVLSATEHPDLKNILGTTTLPDLRGEFLRGWDNGRGIDLDRKLGTFQSDAIRNLQGTLVVNTFFQGTPQVTMPTGIFSMAATYYDPFGSVVKDLGGHNPQRSLLTFNASNQVPTANENRPQNVAVIYIMRILP